jgi:putative ABC transport system ATP-binding protein
MYEREVRRWVINLRHTDDMRFSLQVCVISLVQRMPEMLLTAENIHKTFTTADGPFDVLRGVDLTLDAGESLALTGESGSGKSTLLHLIGGLDTPDQGAIWIDGADIAAMDDTGRAQLRRGVVGVVFQQFNLIPSLRVADNIAFQARLAGRDDPEWNALLADRMGLTAQLRKYPEQLSGGQQQRVAIARTLAARPKLVLADEPTGNLDEATADDVMSLMLELVADTGAGLLMVTHSQALAARLQRRVHLRAGQVA